MAITASCDSVSYLSAVIIGGLAGVIVVYSVGFFDRIKIDDPVGATSVHLVCGVFGTLMAGVFGGANLIVQILGILSIGGFTVVLSTIFWLALKATVGLRVHPEQEFEGLDIAEHGMEAYAGFLKDDVGPGLGSSGSSFPGKGSSVSSRY
ncbi:conserved membrane hypothetical protein [Planktothrix tepida PCC 9214]|uniref:Ammonium transporter AmtB-like domain-containing protein n=1 Tax=Planktothrix tepida PCC 9214 TaxID=671072 RepID=A0A1J1LN16_9CYAN|nr:conserved membrane hypothetical protein [Planktothrix tepida PCC 9214]